MDLRGMLYLLAAIICSAAMTLFLKGFRSEETNRYAIILGNYITCVIIGFILLKEKTQIFHPAGATLLFGTIGGVLFVFSLVVMQRSIEKNGAILTSAFSRIGLIIPLIMSIFVFREQPKLLQYIGILIVLVAVWIINGRRDKDRPASIFLLLLVFLGGGLADGMAKIFNQLGDSSQEGLYVLIVFLAAGMITAGLLFAEYKKTGKPGRLRDYLAGIAVGVPNYFSSRLLLRALSCLPAYIAYTVFSVGAILFTALFSMAVFKEKPGKYQLAGLGLIAVSLVLLNL